VPNPISDLRNGGLRAGISFLSHKKKAVFWRELVEIFPTLIDFLSSPHDLSQVPILWPVSRSSLCWFPGGRFLAG
jgi:hypothetical protein